jgi:glucosamine 6-phosphate synthetase-like amidotransferase/phosphosugar isomerase protein
LSAAWNASGNDLAPNNNGFKKQDATLIALATEADTTVPQLANHTVFVPEAPELLSPILEIIPLQLFAYYVAPSAGSMWIVRANW